jgi:dihydrofolate reductase
MRKLIAKAWISLDGVFDADQDKFEVWFLPYDSQDRAEEIRAPVFNSDAFIYGRTTYEMLAPYWSKRKNNEEGLADKLNDTPKYVISTTLEKAEWKNSTIIKENVPEEIGRLKQQPGQQMMIDGSATLVESLLETDLIDEYQFLVHPIILGSGKRFFKDGGKVPLKLVESKTLSLGVILLRYHPDKKQM